MSASPHRSPISLVFVTQVYDPSHSVLGAVVPMVTALKGCFDEVTVIANDVPPHVAVEPGIIALSRGSRTSRLSKTVSYLAALRRLTGGDGCSVVLAHMCPEYVLAGAPVLATTRTPTFLWFAHPQNSRVLAAAQSLTDGILTSFPGAYPRDHPNLHIIGQAIDVERFQVVDSTPSPDPGLRALALGRMSAMKDFRLVVEATAKAVASGASVTLTIMGPTTTPSERKYRSELERLVRERGLEDRVQIHGSVPYDAVPQVIAEHDVLINASAAGSGDKTVLEAMAVGRPVIVSNPSFSGLLGDHSDLCRFPERDADGLANGLRALSDLGPEGRQRLGRRLRERVESEHSVQSWARRVRAVAEQVCDVRRARNGRP